MLKETNTDKKNKWIAKIGYNTYEESKMGFPIRKMTDKKYTLKEIERAFRLYFQDRWNDTSDIEVVSPEGKEIIWGGVFGREITRHWVEVKKYLK
jgi:hypothetical protein